MNFSNTQLKGFIERDIHHMFSTSWHLKLMRFLFGKWFEMRQWDLKDGKPIDSSPFRDSPSTKAW